MRTTLDIDDDLLTAAKELAKARDTTAGRVISDLLRESLTRIGETLVGASQWILGAAQARWHRHFGTRGAAR